MGDTEYLLRLNSPVFFVPFTTGLDSKRATGCFIVVLFTPLIIFYFLHLSWGKKYTFSKEGCTVQFWFYKRHYNWEELKTKQLLTVARVSLVSQNKTSVFLFSKKKIKKTKFLKVMTAHDFGSVFHPLSFIFLNTVPEEITDEKLKKEFAIYPVREVEFRKKLASWGVGIEEKTI
ncbi:MAG: hypothetical protein IJS94_01580 [Clostridia bacterium]|nr:hypothetical protein [Clostridia bacterium]